MGIEEAEVEEEDLEEVVEEVSSDNFNTLKDPHSQWDHQTRWKS